MYPLFDKNCDLVGWLELGEHIFDTEMNWVGYISGGNVWSAETGDWLGPIMGLTCLDRNGKPILWNPDKTIQTSMRPISPIRATRAIRPIRPIRPINPIRPIRPIVPIGGWSELSWNEWCNQ